MYHISTPERNNWPWMNYTEFPKSNRTKYYLESCWAVNSYRQSAKDTSMHSGQVPQIEAWLAASLKNKYNQTKWLQNYTHPRAYLRWATESSSTTMISSSSMSNPSEMETEGIDLVSSSLNAKTSISMHVQFRQWTEFH